MPIQPTEKRAFAFIDGQNLFHTVKQAFGYKWPNYNPKALAASICRAHNWSLEEIYFYTGIPSQDDNELWHHFWTAKLAAMGTRGIHTFSRQLKYRNQSVNLPNGNNVTVLVGQEKGIDVRLALDVVRFARAKDYDVALIFSQDQDLSEVADEVRQISIDQNRWIKIACAFPISPTYSNKRGINGTDWIKINRSLYDACIDPHDYRYRKKRK